METKMEEQIKEKIIEDIRTKRIVKGTILELMLVENSRISISSLHRYMETTPLQPLSTLNMGVNVNEKCDFGSSEGMSKIMGYFLSYDDKHDRNYFKMSWGVPSNIKNAEFPSFSLEVPFEYIRSYRVLK